MNPMYNFEELKAVTLLDTDTDDYKFLLGVCDDILNNALTSQPYIVKTITKLRIGSLIADYTLTSKQPINQTEVEENLKSSLQTSSQVDTSNGQQSFSGTVNTAALTLKDVNECNTSRPCDVNAQCINTPTSFQCVCNTGYQGNGLACAAVVKPQEENNGWSNDDIVIVSVVFALAFVIIVFLAVAAFIFYKKSDNTTYSTSKNFRESGYDNYLKTDENVDHLKMNMYVAVDPVASSHQSFKTQNETKLNNGRSNGQRKI